MAFVLGALISIAHVSYDERDIAHGFDRLRELTAFADKTRRRHLQVATNMMEVLLAFQRNRNRHVAAQECAGLAG